MTLHNSYRELMEQVEVTSEMRTRILNNLKQAEPAPSRSRGFLKCGILTACAAILVAVGLNHAHQQPEAVTPVGPGVMVTSPFTAADSAEELEQIIGFSVPRLTGLPFAQEELSYRAVGTKLAEVRCTGEGQSAIFRKSLGREDHSGDYQDYACVAEVSLDGLTGQLKGDGEGYTLACWTSAEASYSLKLSTGMGEADWLALIASLSE